VGAVPACPLSFFRPECEEEGGGPGERLLPLLFRRIPPVGDSPHLPPFFFFEYPVQAEKRKISPGRRLFLSFFFLKKERCRSKPPPHSDPSFPSPPFSPAAKKDKKGRRHPPFPPFFSTRPSFPLPNLPFHASYRLVTTSPDFAVIFQFSLSPPPLFSHTSPRSSRPFSVLLWLFSLPFPTCSLSLGENDIPPSFFVSAVPPLVPRGTAPSFPLLPSLQVEFA